MDTFVTVEVIHAEAESEAASTAIERAFGWFANVEQTCSRFDPASELRQLCERWGETVAISPVLMAALSFARALAERTNGAFDPTIGAAMEAAGFDREYRSGNQTGRGIAAGATFRDIDLEPERGIVTLRRPMTLDLGSVAKGLAIDLAAREFLGFRGFVIDAGGDIFAGGRNAAGDAWPIGLRDPRSEGTSATVAISNMAVCTSGDYERSGANGHHIRDPRTATAVSKVASVSVVAPTAMAADALATAAFVLGPRRGISLLEEEGVDGVCYTTTCTRLATAGFEEYLS